MILEAEFTTKINYLLLDNYGFPFFGLVVHNGHTKLFKFLMEHIHLNFSLEKQKIIMSVLHGYNQNNLLHG